MIRRWAKKACGTCCLAVKCRSRRHIHRGRLAFRYLRRVVRVRVRYLHTADSAWSNGSVARIVGGRRASCVLLVMSQLRELGLQYFDSMLKLLNTWVSHGSQRFIERFVLASCPKCTTWGAAWSLRVTLSPYQTLNVVGSTLNILNAAYSNFTLPAIRTC